MKRALALVTAPLLLAATSGDTLSWSRLGRTAYVDGPRVTPLRVIEDSRCPMEARCVWAGRVRIEARVRTGGRSRIRELTLGEPLAVADGQLELASVMPARSVRRAIRPRDYRFGLRFDGGL
jgi:hypothetical protein